MISLVEVLNRIQGIDIYQITVDILQDDFNNLWLIDAYECRSIQKESKNTEKIKVKKALNQRINKWEWGVYWELSFELGELFEDDDDFNPNIVLPGVKKPTKATNEVANSPK